MAGDEGENPFKSDIIASYSRHHQAAQRGSGDYLHEVAPAIGELMAVEALIAAHRETDGRVPSDMQARFDELMAPYRKQVDMPGVSLGFSRGVMQITVKLENFYSSYLGLSGAMFEEMLNRLPREFPLMLIPQAPAGEARDLLRQLVESRAMERVDMLDLSGYPRINAQDVARIAGSSHAGNLQWLSLSGKSVGPAGARALAESPHLSSLVALLLYKGGIGDEGLRALLGSKTLRLRVLDLDNNRISGEGAHLLVNTSMPLESLSLCGNPIPGAAIYALARSPHLKSLADVKLSWKHENGFRNTYQAALTEYIHGEGVVDMPLPALRTLMGNALPEHVTTVQTRARAVAAERRGERTPAGAGEGQKPGESAFIKSMRDANKQVPGRHVT